MAMSHDAEPQQPEKYSNDLIKRDSDETQPQL
jgi:hypothetical protein